MYIYIHSFIQIFIVCFVLIAAYQSQVLQYLVTLSNSMNDMKRQLDFVTTVLQDMHGLDRLSLLIMSFLCCLVFCVYESFFVIFIQVILLINCLQ